jgi:hypothetical protein
MAWLQRVKLALATFFIMSAMSLGFNAPISPAMAAQVPHVATVSLTFQASVAKIIHPQPLCSHEADPLCVR